MVSTWLLFLLLGVGTGAMYAALAMGVIIVYRGSRVVNFALGAMAMFPAVVYAELRTAGDLVLPVVGIPNRYDLGDPLAFAPAAALALAVGLVISYVAYHLIFRPLRNASSLTLVIATVGLTIVLQGLAVKSFGVRTARTPPIMPSDTIMLFGRVVPVDRFWLAGSVIVIGAGLSLLYRKSRFGLATTAAAGNEKGIVLLGYDSARIGSVNWLIASLLVGTVGILVTPLSGVNPFNYSLFVVPALGAALAAGLRSFPKAVAVGIGIGSLESLTVHLVAQRQVPDLLLGGFSSLVAFVVIVGALFFTGRTLPGRSVIFEQRGTVAPLPAVNPITWLAVVAAGAVVIAFGDAPLRLSAIQSMYVATLVMSIVVLTGFVGQVSLAQLAFAGFSAFLLSRFDTVPFPLGPLLAVGITTVVGTLIGVPALRIRGIQFAIVTLSAALVFEQVLFRSPDFVGRGGLAEVESPTLFGADIGILGPGEFPYRPFAYVMLGVTTACALLLVNIRRSAVGRRFLAVRMNERAAAAGGIDVARTKLLGAALASFLAGVAGVMFAYKTVSFNNAGLEAEEGLEILALAYLGGIGSLGGAIIAGVLAPSGLFVVAVSSGAPSVNQFLLTGVGLLVVAIFFPGGLAGVGSAIRRRLPRAMWRDAPPSVGDGPALSRR